jgi:hypothetical protein
LWGWFQFHTSLYARHGLQGRILQLLELNAAPALHAALAAALCKLRSSGSSSSNSSSQPGRLVVVHVRRGDFRELPRQSSSNSSSSSCNIAPGNSQSDCAAGKDAVHLQQQRQLRTQPPFEDGSQGAAWDSNGCDWRAPTAWLLAALAELQLDGAAGDLLWVCSDDVALLQQPEQLLQQLQEYQQQQEEKCCDGTREEMRQQQQQPSVASWVTVGVPAGLFRSKKGGTAGAVDTADAGGGGRESAAADAADAALLADWFVMSQADVLLASNSTLSFTAAMVNAAQRQTAADPKNQTAVTAAASRVYPVAAAAAAAAARVPVFLRPAPWACCYVAFDPWDALPLLPARAALPGNHRLQQQRV